MRKQMILVSHGYFCEALKESVEMIMGTQDNVHAIPLLPNEGPDQFKTKIEKVTKNFKECVVFCDIMGGTSCNVLIKMMATGALIDLYTGMNMPMVIEFENSLIVDKKPDLRNAAISGIAHVNEWIEVQNNWDDTGL